MFYERTQGAERGRTHCDNTEYVQQGLKRQKQQELLTICKSLDNRNYMAYGTDKDNTVT